MRFTTVILVTTSALLVTACGSESGTSGQSVTTLLSSKPAHWSYEGDSGPEYWGELDPAYAACVDGSAQTPIDILDPIEVDLPDPTFEYSPGVATAVNNGHTVQLKAPTGSAVTIDGTQFALTQLHFHAPSEHTIDGVRSAGEVHIVHTADDGELAVVAVLLTEGSDRANDAWGTYVDALAIAEGTEQSVPVDWDAMLPTDATTIRYSGSLTTPPCSEGVRWLVMDEAVTLSPAQIDAFELAYSGNNRPVQPLNDRVVEIDTSRG